MKKIKWKKIFKWTGIGLLLIIIFLALVPFLFKGKIIEEIKYMANEQLNAEVDFSDIEITFFSTFPNLTVSIKDVHIEGKGDFDNIVLYSADNTELTLDLWTVIFSENMKINSILLDQPKIHLLTLEDGRVNYLDILIPEEEKKEEEPTKFKLSLEEFKIINGQLLMEDAGAATKIVLKDINHLTSGDFTEEVFDIETETTIAGLTYEEATGYLLKDVETRYKAKMTITNKEDEMRIELKDNELSMNELSTAINGFYAMYDKYEDMDLSIDGSSIRVKSLLSLIPGAYTSDFSSVKADGDLKFDMALKGKMTEEILPGIDFNLNLSKGSVKYPSLPGTITNINIDLQVKKPEDEVLNAMVVSGKGIHMNMGKNTLDAAFNASNLMVDPYINASLLAKLKLEEVKNYVPMEDGEAYSGNLDAKLTMKGKVSDLEKENYDAFDAAGYIKMDQVKLVTSSVPKPIQIPEANLEFKPEKMDLVVCDVLIGESDMHLTGGIENYIPYVFKEDGILKGGLNFNSDKLNYADLVTEGDEAETATTDTSATEAPEVPENLDLFLKTKVNRFEYPDMPIDNFVGNVTIKEGVLYLDELGMDLLKGRANVNGSYMNKDIPKIKMNVDLNKLDIYETVKAFASSEKMMPYLKDLKGAYSGKLENIEANFDKNLNADVNSIFAKGILQTHNLDATGMEVIQKLKSVGKNIKFLQEPMKANDINISLKVEKGEVFVEEFPIKLKDRNLLVSGSNKLDGSIDYLVKIPVKKKDFPTSVISAVEEQAKKLGLGEAISLPDEVNVNAKITGTYKNPKIALDDLKDMIASNTKGLKDQIVDKVKEEIKEKVEEVKEEIKEDLSKKKEEIMAKAREKAAQIRKDAQEKADKQIEDAMKRINEEIENEKNPIKKKILKEAAKKAEEQARKKSQEIINKGDADAKKVMDDAEKEADALENKI
ncbi:MAG: AsmA family protein [Crocinitomicaceae bacterium]|nr:AsmA family protein [Crocinitomicaceae bacterium]